MLKTVPGKNVIAFLWKTKETAILILTAITKIIKLDKYNKNCFHRPPIILTIQKLKTEGNCILTGKTLYKRTAKRLNHRVCRGICSMCYKNLSIYKYTLPKKLKKHLLLQTTLSF